MANRLCWRCNTRASMVKRYTYGITIELNTLMADKTLAASLYECPECHFPSLGIAKADSMMSNVLNDAANGDQWWLPEAAAGREYSDVPDHIASAADEAHRCRSIDALRACVLMCRSVIEATAKEKGINKGMLQAKIDEMAKQSLIRAHIKEAAHEVRYLGNDMAHGDFVDPVDCEDADEILALMAEVLAEVFQSPARIAKVKADRLAKRRARELRPSENGPDCTRSPLLRSLPGRSVPLGESPGVV